MRNVKYSFSNIGCHTVGKVTRVTNSKPNVITFKMSHLQVICSRNTNKEKEWEIFFHWVVTHLLTAKFYIAEYGLALAGSRPK